LPAGAGNPHRRLLALSALAFLWLVVVALPSLAHSELARSDPADGAVLPSSPSRILMVFTEPPDPDLSTVHVLDASGADVAAGPMQVSGDRVTVPVSDLADGVYTVTWRVVSTTDGHLTAGSFSFAVGTGVAPSPRGTSGAQPAPATSPLGVAGRWFLYVGLIVLFGAAAASLLALGIPSRPGPILLVAWIVAGVGVVLMIAAERSTLGVGLGTLLSSDTGTRLVILAVAVAATGLQALAAGSRPGRTTFLVLAAAAGLAMLARAWGGHAGGSPIAVIEQWLHLMGVGAWIGGLVWLLVAVRRGASPSAVRRFSNLAAAGLGLVVLTGYLRAAGELGGVGWMLHLTQTDYGTALLVKLVLVVGLVALGALNRLRTVPAYAERGPGALRSIVRGELVLAVGALMATAVMTGLPPKPPPPTPTGSQPLVVTGHDYATTTRVQLQVLPGVVGENTFVAEVVDYDTGEPVDATSVSLLFSMSSQPDVIATLDLQRSPDGSWRGRGTSLSLPGRWNVNVLVQGQDGSVQVPLTVEPRTPGQHVSVSRAEGQPDLYTIDLDSGVQIQAYVDPGEPGRTNQLHVTAFDPDGAELPLASLDITATAPDGSTLHPEPIRFSPGHFAANLDITAGRWGFDLQAQTEEGQALQASFDQTFG
jgi:copper transport protein